MNTFVRQSTLPALLLLLLWSATACSKSNSETSGSVSVTADTMTIRSTNDSLKTEPTDANSSATSHTKETTFNGTIVLPADRYATVSVSISGIIKSVNLLAGQYVEKGEVLATIENPEFIELQRDYLDSGAQLEYLETDYKRQQSLAKEQAASQKRLEQSKAEYLAVKNRHQAAKAKLQLLGVSPETIDRNGIQTYLSVRAPLAGYIDNMQMNIGRHFEAGAILCDVLDKRRVMLKLLAYEKDLKTLRVNDEIVFRVNGYGSREFQGKIISISQHVEETSRSIEVFASIQNSDPGFRRGMYAAARLKKQIRK